jgi:hypothetical protein
MIVLCPILSFLTTDGVFRGAKMINLYKIVTEAIKICNEKGFDVAHTIVANHAGSKLTDIDGVTKTWFHVEEEQGNHISTLKNIHINLSNASSTASADDSPVEWVDAEHPLFLLYTRCASLLIIDCLADFNAIAVVRLVSLKVFSTQQGVIWYGLPPRSSTPLTIVLATSISVRPTLDGSLVRLWATSPYLLML